MKKINLSINISKARNNPRVGKLIQQISARIKPIIDYYNRLTEREKQIVFYGGIFLIFMMFYLLISAANDFKNSLETDYAVIQTYRADAEYLVKEYKEVNQLTPNEYSDVSTERIKGDLSQISNNNPDVELTDGVLSIEVPEAKFTDIMNLLNQFRKSYGIFPLTLKITRLSESGYASFSATFKVNSQNAQQ